MKSGIKSIVGRKSGDQQSLLTGYTSPRQYGSSASSTEAENEVALTLVGDDLFKDMKKTPIPSVLMENPSVDSQKQLISAWFNNMSVNDQFDVMNSITSDCSSARMAKKISFKLRHV